MTLIQQSITGAFPIPIKGKDDLGKLVT